MASEANVACNPVRQPHEAARIKLPSLSCGHTASERLGSSVTLRQHLRATQLQSGCADQLLQQHRKSPYLEMPATSVALSARTYGSEQSTPMVSAVQTEMPSSHCARMAPELSPSGRLKRQVRIRQVLQSGCVGFVQHHRSLPPLDTLASPPPFPSRPSPTSLPQSSQSPRLSMASQQSTCNDAGTGAGHRPMPQDAAAADSSVRSMQLQYQGNAGLDAHKTQEVRAHMSQMLQPSRSCHGDTHTSCQGCSSTTMLAVGLSKPLSQQASRISTQWDDLYGQDAARGMLHKLIRRHAPLEPGAHGGGGVQLVMLDLWSPREIQALKVLRHGVRQMRARTVQTEMPSLHGARMASELSPSGRLKRQVRTRQVLESGCVGFVQHRRSLPPLDTLASPPPFPSHPSPTSPAQSSQSPRLSMASQQSTCDDAVTGAGHRLVPQDAAAADSSVSSTQLQYQGNAGLDAYKTQEVRAHMSQMLQSSRSSHGDTHASCQGCSPTTMLAVRFSKPLSQQASRISTQWDDLYGQDAAPGMLRTLIRRHAPLEPGAHGGGGVQLAILDLWCPREIQALKVLRHGVRQIQARARSRAGCTLRALGRK